MLSSKISKKNEDREREREKKKKKKKKKKKRNASRFARMCDSLNRHSAEWIHRNGNGGHSNIALASFQ